MAVPAVGHDASQKHYDLFIKELVRRDMDINQPTRNGKLPIIEAVKTGDLRFVEAVIQAQATIKVKKPSSGVSPVFVAFQTGQAEIARLLLAYGADPNVQAKDGKTAADVLSSPAIKELYDAWERDGAAAFEDAPGTWRKERNEEHGDYFWHNQVANKVQWNLPPSCAWQRVDYQDGPAKFVNHVTGQTVYRTPKPLQWCKTSVNSGGMAPEEVWYHWTLHKSLKEAPHEMPQYLLDEAEKNINNRWWNPKTGEVSWEDPRLRSHWRKLTDEQGQEYYYNVQSGESTREVPQDFAWTRHVLEDGGETYWSNSQTGETRWHHPEHLHDHWHQEGSEL